MIGLTWIFIRICAVGYRISFRRRVVRSVRLGSGLVDECDGGEGRREVVRWNKKHWDFVGGEERDGTLLSVDLSFRQPQLIHAFMDGHYFSRSIP